MTRKCGRSGHPSLGVCFLAILTASVSVSAVAGLTNASEPSATQAGAVLLSDAVSQVPPAHFATAVPYSPGGANALAVAVGDLNGDGKPDLAVSNYDGTVGVLLGNGDGTFQPAVVYGTGGYRADSIVIADMNGDGKPDLVVANCGPNAQVQCSSQVSGVIGVLLGNGDGTFQTVITSDPGGAITRWLAVADVNGDGKLDIVVANECSTGGSCEGSVGVLLGNGDGTFQAVATYDSGGAMPESIAIGDLNGDGHPDIVVGNSYGNVGVLLGNGDGTFQAVVTYPSGGGGVGDPCGVAVADVNGDGHPDVIAVGGNQVGVLIGNGDGTLRAPVSYGSGAWMASSVAVADVNGDGHPDLVVSNWCATGEAGCVTALAGVLLGNGDGTFQPVKTYATGGFGAMMVAVADVSNDGRPDLLVANDCQKTCSYSSVGVLLNVTQFLSSTKVGTSGSPSFIEQPVTFTATVTSSVPIPDGITVTFRDGASEIGTGTTVSGVATFTTSLLSAKTHAIRASYPGSAFSKASAGTISQVVEKHATSTTVASKPNPSAYGQAVTFTATVTQTGPYSPTGKVTFKDGTKVLGSPTLSGGVATLTKLKLAVGTHSITAEYMGDADNATSISAVLEQVVQ